MSIIFEKLRGVKKAPGETSRKSGKLSKKRNVYNLRKFVFSPVGALLSLCFIGVIGILSFYSLYYLKTYFDKTRSRHTKNQIALKNLRNPMDGTQVKHPFLETDMLQADAFAKDSKTKAPDRSENLSDAPNAENELLSDADSPPLPGELKTVAQEEQKNELNKTKPVKEKKVPKKDLTAKETALSKEENAFQKTRMIKQKKIELISRISQIAKEIETHLSNKDYVAADELIQTLTDLKTYDNYYLLKLKAYIEIKSGRLKSASYLLTKVLKDNPEDLEAGINMAVVEVKQNRVDLAKKRLVRLQESHPACSRVEALLDQL
ncbi:MAG: tetratricopeptide repeat protein [Desulfobacteraceae bacterium]|nr:tetratricopeptide repeat protein [Desulfobacteraceae bacterium]